MTDFQQGRVIEQHESEEILQKTLDQFIPLQQGKEVLSDDTFEVIEVPLEAELDALAKPSKKSWMMRLFVSSLLALVGVELTFTMINAINTSPALAVVYGVAIASALALIARVVWREFKLLRKLKSTKIRQLEAERLVDSVQIGEAKSFLRSLEGVNEHSRLTDMLAQVMPHHTDKEVMELYTKTVLKEQDDQAQKIIKKYAATSGLMVSISPIALVDMAVVLWRSTKMIEEITDVYGLPLGYVSRMRLYRMTFKQVLFAGSAELLSDFATTAISAELTGKISARAAQGISISIFTARIGYKAMQLSRPIGMLSNKKNLLTSCVTLALKQFKVKTDN